MSTPTKRERRDAARQARLEREAAEAAAARRKRRMFQLLAALGAAAVLVVVAILVSSGGGKSTPNASTGGDLQGVSETSALLNGVPQSGNVLGKASAPVTIYEFADLQCPFCKDFSTQNLPLLVRDYVANGKAKLVYQDMAFIGPDSETAAAAADAAGQQGKLWDFTNLFYWNQGEENTGYVNDALIAKIYKAIPGLDVAKAEAYRKTDAAKKSVEKPRELANQYGVSSTPSFVAGPTGGALKKLTSANGSDYNSIKQALDPIVASAGT